MCAGVCTSSNELYLKADWTKAQRCRSYDCSRGHAVKGISSVPCGALQQNCYTVGFQVFLEPYLCLCSASNDCSSKPQTPGKGCSSQYPAT